MSASNISTHKNETSRHRPCPNFLCAALILFPLDFTNTATLIHLHESFLFISCFFLRVFRTRQNCLQPLLYHVRYSLYVRQSFLRNLVPEIERRNKLYSQENKTETLINDLSYSYVYKSDKNIKIIKFIKLFDNSYLQVKKQIDHKL